MLLNAVHTKVLRCPDIGLNDFVDVYKINVTIKAKMLRRFPKDTFRYIHSFVS